MQASSSRISLEVAEVMVYRRVRPARYCSRMLRLDWEHRGVHQVQAHTAWTDQRRICSRRD